MASSNPSDIKKGDTETTLTSNTDTNKISGSTDKGEDIETQKSLRIYDLYSRRKRNSLLAIAGVGSILLPFSDTIYLPALESMRVYFNTTEALIATSVSIYLIFTGIFSMLWGLLLDRYGRRIPLLLASSIFVGVTFACVFAPNIDILIVFRALEGACVTCLLLGGQSVVADVFPPEIRGFALGVFNVPFLVGPVIGPLIGGAVAEKFGWSSTFMTLLVLAGLIFFAIAVFVPETQPYIVLQTLMKKKDSRVARLAETIKENPKPSFFPPWKAMLFMLDPTVAPFGIIFSHTIGMAFLTLTTMPSLLASPPYNLSESVIGICYIPFGVGVLTSSLLGGKLSDYGRVKYLRDGFDFGSMIPASILVACGPLGAISFVWTLYYGIHPVVPLLFQYFTGFSLGVYIPSISSYLTIIKREQAAAANASTICVAFCYSGVLVSVAPIIQQYINIGWTVTLFALFEAFCIVVVLCHILRKYSQAPKNTSIELPPV